MSPVEEALRSIIRDSGRIKPNEPMKKHTTYRIGGPADYLVEVADRTELREVMALAAGELLPVYILGNGSNLLVSDDGVRGFVLVLRGEFDTYRIEGTRVIAGGGCDLPRLAVAIARAGLGGLEFACGVPGTAGAGLVINAGAHGGDMSRVVHSATVVWSDGREETLPAGEVGFGYRSSRLQGSSAVVVEVTMDLEPVEPDQAMEKIQRYLERRRNTQPLLLPNAGSVFTNPPGNYAARLIEQAGLKGMREGGAQVSEKHANFIVNNGDATAKDVLILMDRIRTVVQERFGVRLEPEVKIWGKNPYFLF
jgi:UDP-N-acetylmuramate dehydrogenase